MKRVLWAAQEAEGRLWLTVRNRPVPWFLFLATTLAAIIISSRG